MYLTFHVTSHDKLIEGSCQFMRGCFLQYVSTLKSFVTISIVFNCHVTSSEHMFKRLYEFMGGSPSW